MVMAKKIVFEIIADSDCTTLKNMKKSHFSKSVCVCAVSYTHLDVYKRQLLPSPCELNFYWVITPLLLLLLTYLSAATGVHVCVRGGANCDLEVCGFI